jgi:hypothetical protein
MLLSRIRSYVEHYSTVLQYNDLLFMSFLLVAEASYSASPQSPAINARLWSFWNCVSLMDYSYYIRVVDYLCLHHGSLCALFAL